MRSSVAVRLCKALSFLCAVALCCGLIPITAYAVPESLSSIPEGEQGAAPIVSGAEGGQSDVLALRSDDDAPSVDGGGAASTSENAIDNDESTVIPAGEIINQTMPLQVVAQAESTRSYFLAQTLESTRTVPIVSANLPLDTGTAAETGEPIDGGESSQDEEGDVSDDDSDSNDLDRVISIEASDSERSGEISAESTVIGSFMYRGITYAVEPGGESVAIVATDYVKLPEEFIEVQTIVLPSMVTADNLNYYSVTRIADYAFSSITAAVASENSESVVADSGVRTQDEACACEVTAVTIPASITEIDDDAFTGFDTLQYVIVSEDNPDYGMYDGCLYNADQTCLLLVPEGRQGAVRIAPSAITVDSAVFSHCDADTIILNPDSAAYQLHSEIDGGYTNANGNQIRIRIANESEALSLTTLDIDFYSSLITALSEETEAHFLSTEESHSALEVDSRSAMNSFNLSKLGLERSSGAIYTAGKDEHLYTYGYCRYNTNTSLAVTRNPVTWADYGNCLVRNEDYIKYYFFMEARRVLNGQTSPNASPSGYHTISLNPTLPNASTVATYDGGIVAVEFESHARGVADTTWVYAPMPETIVIGSDYFATYYVGVDESYGGVEGEFLDWPWTYGNVEAKSPTPKKEGYIFVGWFDSIQTQVDPYADGKYVCGGIGKADGTRVALVPSLSRNIDLYAHYALAEYDVTFDANGALEKVSDKDPVVWVKFGQTMPTCLKTSEKADGVRPYSDNETYADANKGASLTAKESPVVTSREGNYVFDGYWTKSDGGTQYYDKDMNPLRPWNEVDLKTTRLYAHWKSHTEISFAPGAVEVGTSDNVSLPSDMSAFDGQRWTVGEDIPSVFPVPSNTEGFSREGYAFRGWYYEDADGNHVFVSDGNGARLAAAKTWQWETLEATLYGSWKANAYRLSFDPSCSKAGEAAGTGAYMMDVAYDGQLSVTSPSCPPYPFSGWYLSDGTPLSSHMTDGRFMPDGDLASQTWSGAGDPIAVHAEWGEPTDKHFTRYIWYPNDAGRAVALDEERYGYGAPNAVLLDESYSLAAPSGWRFEGWVEYASGPEAAKAIADDAVSGTPLSKVEALTEAAFADRFLVAKWSTLPFEVHLKDTVASDGDESYVMASDSLVAHEGVPEGVLSWSQVCESNGTTLLYDVRMGSFALPDVVREGYDFSGWKRVDGRGGSGPTDGLQVVVDPATIAADAAHLDNLVFEPSFTPAAYTIVLDGNGYGKTQSFSVPYTGSFSFPWPETIATGSCFTCWASAPRTGSASTKRFSPLQSVAVMKGANDGFGLPDLDADGDRTITLYAIWNASLNLTVPVRVTTMAIDTESGDMVAAGQDLAPANSSAYEVISLSCEPVLDETVTDPAKRAPFSGAGSGHVYLSVYAGLAEPADETSLLSKGNVGEKGVLAYTDKQSASRTAVPLLIELGSAETTLVGRSAAAGSTVLTLDSVTDATARSGFRTFSKTDPLTVRYGLVFEGVDPKAFDFDATRSRWSLPERDHANTSTTEGRRVGWSSKSQSLAKLCYTVRVIENT